MYIRDKSIIKSARRYKSKPALTSRQEANAIIDNVKKKKGINTLKYIENCLKIRTKDAKLIKLKLNKGQMKLYDVIKKQHQKAKPIRVIILKARQIGFSTLTEAIIFKKTATSKNVTSAIVAHKSDATSNLFRMSKRFYNYLPQELKPKTLASNAYELIFDTRDGKGLGSAIKCYTAGGGNIGRSDTTQNLHISELAYWEGDKAQILLGLLQSVPNTPDSMIIIESTANGYDYYKELWDRAVAGESEYIPVFVGWHEMDEYRMPYTGFKLTENEERLKKLYDLDNEQLAWRRWCIVNQCNKSIDLFNQEYPACPEDAFISSGKNYFGSDGQKLIIERLQELRDMDGERGYFEYEYDGLAISSIRWVKDNDGYITIYKHPKRDYPYVIGGDTAGEGSDYYVGQVINNVDGKQVAVFRKQMGAELYARQMFCLGQYYNEALLAIEMNFDSYPNLELSRLGYKNIYFREKSDTAMIGTVDIKYGFRTSTITRPRALSGLAAIVREDTRCIMDKETLREMLTFVVNDNGKAVADSGKHDDLIMALAIAYDVRPQQSSRKPELMEEQRRTWHKDMWEDYYNADAEGKAYLRKKWGSPA